MVPGKEDVCLSTRRFIATAIESCQAEIRVKPAHDVDFPHSRDVISAVGGLGRPFRAAYNRRCVIIPRQDH